MVKKSYIVKISTSLKRLAFLIRVRTLGVFHLSSESYWVVWTAEGDIARTRALAKEFPQKHKF